MSRKTYSSIFLRFLAAIPNFGQAERKEILKTIDIYNNYNIIIYVMSNNNIAHHLINVR